DLREPQFAHEEVMEIKAELRADIRIRELLVWQLNRKSDGFASRFIGSAIGGLHDAGTAAGADDKAARARTEGEGPSGDFVRKLTRLFVIDAHLQGAPGGAELFAMLLKAPGTPAGGFHFLKARVAGGGSFAGLDARRAEHDNGVADALILELNQGMDVLGDNADGTRRRAGHELVIFVGSFWGML